MVSISAKITDADGATVTVSATATVGAASDVLPSAASGMQQGTSTGTNADFMKVGASDSLLIFALIAETSALGTISATWGTQAMTQIGATVVKTGGAAPVSISVFGLVNPAAGSKIMSWSSALNVNSYMIGESFTGTNTTSVAVATFGFASASGTGTSASVTSTVPILDGTAAISFFADAGNGFSGAFPTTAIAGPKVAGSYPSDGGTSIGENENLTTNAAAETYSGAGVAITASAPLASSDVWAAVIVGVH
jgi:hypothetical protein